MLVGYARISTKDQNIELQIDALKNAGCEKIFHEAASGANDNRPQFKKVMEFIREKDTLVVWKFDRVARSTVHLSKTIKHLDEQGIGFKSLTENIDTNSNTGKLVLHILGAIAEFERGLIRERTVAGIAAARARGNVGGRPLALSHDDLDLLVKRLEDPSVTKADLARELGISQATLYRHIKDYNILKEFA